MYPQSMFLIKNKKILNPCIPQFYEGGSESSVIGGVTLLIDMIDCCIIS